MDVLQRIQELEGFLREANTPQKRERAEGPASTVSTGPAEPFSKEVDSLLRAWRYPPEPRSRRLQRVGSGRCHLRASPEDARKGCPCDLPRGVQPRGRVPGRGENENGAFFRLENHQPVALAGDYRRNTP